jgi:hypothetical protein
MFAQHHTDCGGSDGACAPIMLVPSPRSDEHEDNCACAGGDLHVCAKKDKSDNHSYLHNLTGIQRYVIRNSHIGCEALKTVQVKHLFHAFTCCLEIQSMGGNI